jgi:tetratricopeptide (TPR) repeat protein
MKRAENRMRRAAVAACLLILALPLAGCNKLAGRQHFHKANALYENENYRRALAEFKAGLERDPSATFAWRSVGLSALALFRPDEDTPENKAMGDEAVNAFRRYLEAYPDDEKVREYLIGTLMGTARHDEAIQVLEEDARRHPGDKKYGMAVVRALTDAGKLEQAMQRAESLGGDPDVYYTIGVSAWAKSYYQPPASVEDHRKLIELGRQALEKADQVRPNHFDTLSYLNLLWREMVKVEIDPFKQQEYVQKAQGYFERAMTIRREQEEKDKKAAAQAAT